MPDPREIEGSAERAADRGREEDLGFTVTARPSLGDPDVVRWLAAEFAASVVGVRRRYNEDRLSGEQAQAELRDLAAEYGRVIMGFDSRYQALPWHDPRRLGRRIGLVVPAIDGVSDPGLLLFLTVGASLIEIAVAHEDGRITDDDAKAQAETMLSDTVDLILGVR